MGTSRDRVAELMHRSANNNPANGKRILAAAVPVLVLVLVLFRATQSEAAASAVLGGPLPPPPPTHQEGDQRLLIPAYFDPGPAGAKWKTMCERIRTNLAVAVIIMNPPPNGDFAEDDLPPRYKDGMNACLDRGQDVIGYVYTNGGNRGQAVVRSVIDRYYHVFPRIRGIFVDQMANAPVTDPAWSTTRAYYRSLYRYVKHKSHTAKVIGNPGVAAATDWQLRKPRAVDIVVDFEGPYIKRVPPDPNPDPDYFIGFKGWTAPAWVSAWPANRFAHLVYRSTNKATTRAACKASDQTHAGWIFVTADNFDADAPANTPSASPWDFPPGPAMLACPTLYRRAVFSP
jgi:hypothetical protein